MTLHSHELQIFSFIPFYHKICASVGQPEVLMYCFRFQPELNRPKKDRDEGKEWKTTCWIDSKVHEQ
jgi:hypothetical protein